MNKRLVWGIILATSLGRIWLLRFIISMIFFLVAVVYADGTQSGELLQIIKNFINRLLGILGMISLIVGTPLGIFLIATNKKKWTNKVIKPL